MFSPSPRFRHGVVEMRMLLKELKAEGKAILLASHNAQDIEELCDHVQDLMLAAPNDQDNHCFSLFNLWNISLGICFIHTCIQIPVINIKNCHTAGICFTWERRKNAI